MSRQSFSSLTSRALIFLAPVRLKKRLDRQLASGPASGILSPSHADTTASTPLDLDQLSSELKLAVEGSDEEDAPSKPLVMPDVRELDENFETAFQLAMNKGPLCAEPVVGMAYFLEEVKVNEELEVATSTSTFIPDSRAER